MICCDTKQTGHTKNSRRWSQSQNFASYSFIASFVLPHPTETVLLSYCYFVSGFEILSSSRRRHSGLTLATHCNYLTDPSFPRFMKQHGICNLITYFLRLAISNCEHPFFSGFLLTHHLSNRNITWQPLGMHFSLDTTTVQYLV